MKIFIVIVFSLTLLSCKKNQSGGDSSLHGQVKHHGKVIPSSRVFIKFDAEEFPGTDTMKYDAKVTTDAAGTFSFSLYQGTYFLFGRGFDPGVPGYVTGGLKYRLRSNEDKELDIPVTEE